MPTSPPDWISTEASVTSCRFQFARMNTLTLGVQTSKKFRITFDYYAHGQLHSSEFQSEHAIPQGELLPIRYNPLDPRQNSRASFDDITSSSAGRTLLLIGGVSALLLSFVSLAWLHGCS